MWKVERGFCFIPRNLDENEAAIIDVLFDFFNQGRIFGLSFREVENYLRDKNQIRAFPENLISEKLAGGWIRDLIRAYYSCNVPQKYFHKDFSKLDLVQKIQAIKDLIDSSNFKGIKIELVDIDDLELVFKIDVGHVVEGLSLDGFVSFWQDYLRKFFKNKELIILLEKNL